MPATKIRTVVTITLGFYVTLLYPALKTEVQRSGLPVQLPSTPGKTQKYTQGQLLVRSPGAMLVP